MTTTDPSSPAGPTFAEVAERYRAMKGARPTPAVAAEMGVTPATLLRYERAGIAGRATMDRVVAWVGAQEDRLRTHLRTRLSRGAGGMER